MDELSFLYGSRKCGSRQGLAYRIRVLQPSLLLFLVSLVLAFSLTFIVSVSSSIDMRIQLLGSGTVYSDEEIDPGLAGARVDRVVNAEGLLYSGNGQSVVYLKGVDQSYFDERRMEAFRMESASIEGRKILISSLLADSLGLEPGDRLTLLVYEEEKGRTRPMLMTVGGIFRSGYAQLDRYLAYVDADEIEGRTGYEVLLESGDDAGSLIERLRADGNLGAVSYRELYSDLYMNVSSSVTILYAIFIAVLLLAAFFSSDIAQVYVSRDRKDIGVLMLLGRDRGSIRRDYLMMTSSIAAFSSASGIITGVLLSFLSPSLMKAIAVNEPSFFEYYVTSFEITVPALRLFLMLLMLIIISSITIFISIRRIGKEEIRSVVG